MRDIAVDGAHPWDAAQRFLEGCTQLDRAGRVLVLRDLAVSIRRERGQRRQDAQAATDAFLADSAGAFDLDHLIGMCAEDLVRRWSPRARWAPPTRGQHMVVVQLDYSAVSA